MRTLRGGARRVGGATLTPIARRLAIRWPGGGWVYAWPSAIEIQTEQGTRRARILPVQRLALAALAGLALAALTGAVGQWLLNRRPETEANER
jgi:hypothetical protein